MNPIGELLQAEDIRLDVDVASKQELLDRISEILAKRHNLPQDEVREGLAARERLGSTALGHGVAIPHARMKHLQQAAGSFVRTRLPIPFDAPDGRAVSSVLLLLVPAEATDQHLRLMANAASMLGDRSFRAQLKCCAQPCDVEDLISTWPDVADDAGTAKASDAGRGG
jgi:PTS system nitrogen regulatory IIA component